MRRSNGNHTTLLTKKMSFRGWLKRVAIPNSVSNRNIGSDNTSKDGVFGVPLETSMKYAKTTVGFVDNDDMNYTTTGSIPIVIAKCGSYLKNNGLEVQGVFRISGSFARVNALEFQFDQSTSGYGLNLDWEGYTVLDAANLLTRYLNKLPDPVIPFKYYQKFRDVMNNNAYKDAEHRIEAFQKLIQSLPPAHQHLLLYLLDLLSLFATTASKTKMDISNLSSVICPGILRHPDHNTPVQYKLSQHVIEFLLEFQSSFTMRLLTSNMEKNASTFISSCGDAPTAVPLLPSSYPESPPPPPPVPLHAVSPPAPSKLSVPIKERSVSPLSEPPLKINAQDQQQKNIDIVSASLPSTLSTLSTKDPSSRINIQTPFMHRETKVVATSRCHILPQEQSGLKSLIEPRMAKAPALLLCISVLLVTLMVAVYEAYLATTLCSFEPYVFFSGFVAYWGLLYGSLPPSAPSTPAAIANAKKATIQGESIGSEWRDLPTRAWKADDSDDLNLNIISTAPVADDVASLVVSGSSQIDDEEESAPTTSVSSSDDDDMLEMYLSVVYAQDAQLAKQLQIKEQEDMAVCTSRSIENITTQTDDKEQWKFRAFRR